MGDAGSGGAPRRGDERWERVRAQLRAELGEDVFQSWFVRVDFEELTGALVRLSAPTRFLKGWISANYGDRLVALWAKEVPGIRRVEIVQRSGMRAPAQEPAATTAAALLAPHAMAEEHDPASGSPLDPRLSFESFCEGLSNDVAARAARAVALAVDGIPPLYNPLYIHAGVGLGKTHLLQSIAHEASMRRRVLYLTAERFAFQFVASLRDRQALDFKERVRAIDLFLVDDVQFLTGRAIQQEFCHVLNALLDAGRQIVVAGDRPPADLEGLDERVKSRLKGGVVVGIARPDTLLRRGILAQRYRAARERNPKLHLSDTVLDYLAAVIVSNGRDLDGALNRLICRAEFSDEPITVAVAEGAIADLLGTREVRRIRIEEIQKIVASHYQVSKADLLSERRTRVVVRPRQVAMYLAKTMTPRSFPEIGKRFGGRDHTTVLHAVRKIEELSANDPVLADEIALLKRLIQE